MKKIKPAKIKKGKFKKNFAPKEKRIVERTNKYFDLNSFLKLLLISMLALVVVLLVMLGYALFKSSEIAQSQATANRAFALANSSKITKIDLKADKRAVYLGDHVYISFKTLPDSTWLNGDANPIPVNLTTAHGDEYLVSDGVTLNNGYMVYSFLAKKIGVEQIIVKSIDGYNKKASLLIVIAPKPKVAAIILKATEKTVYLGDKVNVSYKSMPAINPMPLEMTTSSENAILSKDGVTSEKGYTVVGFTAKSLGTEIITVKSTDGSDKTKAIQIKVVEKPLTSKITLGLNKLIVFVGEEVTLYYKGKPLYDPQPFAVTTASKNTILSEGVATENTSKLFKGYAAMKFTALAKGTEVILVNATDGSNKLASIKVTVIERPKTTSVVVVATKKKVYVGDKVDVTYSSVPLLNTTPLTMTTSSNNEVLLKGDVINKKGYTKVSFTAKALGKEVITVNATDGSNKSKSIEIEVVARPLTSKITLGLSKLVVFTGEEVTLYYKGTPLYDPQPLTVTTASANTILGAGVATENTSKLYKGYAAMKFTALTKGTEIITVNATDGSNKLATIKVTVVERPKTTAVILTSTKKTVYVGDKIDVTYSSVPLLNTAPLTMVTSSNNEVLLKGDVINKKGYTKVSFTAKALGTEVITVNATDGSNKSKSIEIKVIEKPLTSKITLGLNKLIVKVGKEVILYYKGTPLYDPQPLVVTTASRNTILGEGVATKNTSKLYKGYSAMKFTALAKGTEVILVNSTDGSNKLASIKVTVVK